MFGTLVGPKMISMLTIGQGFGVACAMVGVVNKASLLLCYVRGPCYTTTFGDVLNNALNGIMIFTNAGVS